MYIKFLTPVTTYIINKLNFYYYNLIKINTLSNFLNIEKNVIKNYFKEIRNIRIYAPGMASALDTIYVIIRLYKPEIIVETGVASGASSFYILLALNKNKKGKLYSIDYPNLDPSAKLPEGKEVGWLVPHALRKRWSLIIEKVEIALPKLLKELEHLDIFFHDSLHTYEHMMFEYKLAWNKLGKDGILISDNIDLNNAFRDFCNNVKASWIELANVGFAKK